MTYENFKVIGVSHKSAPMDIVAAMTFTDSRKFEFLHRLESVGTEQCMILSTCNRSELYFISGSGNAAEEYISICPAAREYIYQYEGIDAIKHLFAVTAGLESLVMGEDQISGQVSDAFKFSLNAGFGGKELNIIVLNAVTCAKLIKNELKISTHPLSVSYIGIKELDRICGIKGKTLMIIGSGAAALLAARYSAEYGADKIILCCRGRESAEKITEETGICEWLAFSKRYSHMAECDAVISATSAPHMTVTHDMIRFDKEMYLLDLALPYDIDPAFENDKNVFLISMASLKETADINYDIRRSLSAAAYKIIDEKAEETLNQLICTRVDDTIKSLKNICDDISSDSFEYLMRKINMNDREKKIIKRTLDSALHRLIREPVSALKNLTDTDIQDEYKRIIKDLWKY